MKGIKMVLAGLFSAVILTSAFTMDVYAGNGKGQMLRDGSGSGAKWQGANQANQGATKGKYGDGTQPRPMDGTGFGRTR